MYRTAPFTPALLAAPSLTFLHVQKHHLPSSHLDRLLVTYRHSLPHSLSSACLPLVLRSRLVPCVNVLLLLRGLRFLDHPRVSPDVLASRLSGSPHREAAGVVLRRGRL